MRTRNWIILIVVSFLAGGLFTGVFFIGRSRSQSRQIAELERLAVEYEQRYAECNQQLRDVCTEIEDYNRRAREITDSMAKQLERDTDDITKARTIVKHLRKEIELLEGGYTNLSNSIRDYHDRNNDNSVKE